MISIIIPVFNGENCIEKCINSINEQSQYINDVEIIVVNDGSTDKTSVILEQLSIKHSNIKVFNKNNGGVSSARNFGLRVASGKYVLFIDADDTVKKNAFSVIMTELMTKQADFYIFPIEKEIKKGVIEKQTYKFIGKTVPVSETYERFFVEGNNGPWSKLFDLDIIRKNGIYFHEELKIHEDVIFCMEYIEHCYNVCYCDQTFYTYSYNENGAVQRHKLEYLNNYSTVYYFWLDFLIRHELSKYVTNLNCIFLHKMLITSAKLKKHGLSVEEINRKLIDNRLFNEIKRMHFKNLRWNMEKLVLIYKLYFLISFKVK